MEKSAHQTAAECLALTVLNLFPQTLLLGGAGTSAYFYYDFLFPFSLDKQSLKVIEEHLTRLLKKQIDIKKREMTLANAAELFNSFKQTLLANKLSNSASKRPQELVEICQIEEFFDYCPYPLSPIPKPFYLKLLSMEKIGFNERPAIRIIGVLFSDKQELKNFVKQTPSPAAFSHLNFAMKQKLFLPFEGVWLWLPKGEVIRQTLIQWWQKAIDKISFNLISIPSTLPQDERSIWQRHQYCFSRGYNRLAEIVHLAQGGEGNDLFETKSAFADRFTHIDFNGNFSQMCISYLQFILEMPKILGFEFQVVLGLPKAKKSPGSRSLKAALEELKIDYMEEMRSALSIVVRIPDALGRLWDGPFLSVPNPQEKSPALIGSALGALERLVGLTLERHKGVFPLWLAPEQRERTSESEN